MKATGRQSRYVLQPLPPSCADPIPSYADPMEMAAWFMARWEREQGVDIGEGEDTDLARLDDCLRDYGSHCAAEAATASLFGRMQ